MTPTTHPAVTDYLRAVDRALTGLPPARREEIVADLREHVDGELAEHPDADEAYVRTVLDRLGTPADIADEAGVRFGTAPQRSRAREYWAIALVGPGSLPLGPLGWVVGISMVWTSRVFSRSAKVCATVLVPFGFSTAILPTLWKLDGAQCVRTDGSVVCSTLAERAGWASLGSWLLILALWVGPLVSTAVLVRDVRRAKASAL